MHKYAYQNMQEPVAPNMSKTECVENVLIC